MLGFEKNGHRHDSGAEPPKNKFFIILVVEGPVAYEDFLEAFLRTEGHYIVRANTAEEALAMTKKHRPDLVLLNREMVGSNVNGLKFLPELLMAHPSAAIVMMATKPSVAEAVEAMVQGAVNYLERPLDRLLLKKTIDQQKALFRLLPEF